MTANAYRCIEASAVLLPDLEKTPLSSSKHPQLIRKDWYTLSQNPNFNLTSTSEILRCSEHFLLHAYQIKSRAVLALALLCPGRTSAESEVELKDSEQELD